LKGFEIFNTLHGMEGREKIIRNYIEGYNHFDVDKMIADLDDNITFENIQDGEINMSLTGLAAFRRQAQQAASYFIRRKQVIKTMAHSGDETKVEVDYYAVLAIDFPDGLKKGQELRLKGESVFKFSANNRVIKLTDIS
jgi:hypothetical protein